MNSIPSIKIHYVLLFGIIFSILLSCDKREHNPDFDRLVKLDSLILKSPESALDSLKKTNLGSFSKYNRAYYNLLIIIASDKSYVNFTSDSLINQVVNDLSSYRVKHPNKYARALMYQGLVRYRLGRTDDLVYKPIKDAAKIFENTKPKDLKSLQLCYIYIGDLNFSNNNPKLSYYYFKQAIHNAKALNDKRGIFFIYMSLFWNEMQTNNYSKAKAYLDTLDLLKESINNSVDLSVAHATYFKNVKEYKKALIEEYNLLRIPEISQNSTIVSKVYFRMTENYRELNKPDSALKYAKLAEKVNVDTSDVWNYHYYKNIGEIAVELNSWKEGAMAFQKAYNLLNKSIQKQLDTDVLELEKKYDLSEAQNKKLVAEKRSYIYLAFLSALFTLIVYFFFSSRQRLIKERLAKEIIEHEFVLQNHQLTIAKQDSTTKRWVNDLYQYVIERDKKLENLLYKLENNKLFRQDEKLLHLLNDTLNEYNKEMKESSIKLLDEDMFKQFTGLTSENAKLLLDSEKLLLVLMVCEMSNKQIASLIGSSAESIRKRRGLLIKKLEENKIILDTEKKNIIISDIIQSTKTGN